MKKFKWFFTPCFAAPFPVPAEPVLFLDREPIATRLDFAYNNSKEDIPMNKIEFVIHCIRHHEDFPNVGEITPESAQAVLDNLQPSPGIPSMTAQEFMTHWNVFVHDPKVMSQD